MTDADLEFPVICFFPESVMVCHATGDLTHTNMLGVKNKCMVGIEIVDARFRRFQVDDMETAHGIGRFGGHNLFLNQNVKARLTLSVAGDDLDLSELKNRVIASVRKNRSWHAAGGDVNEMIAAIFRAGNFGELASYMF